MGQHLNPYTCVWQLYNQRRFPRGLLAAAPRGLGTQHFVRRMSKSSLVLPTAICFVRLTYGRSRVFAVCLRELLMKFAGLRPCTLQHTYVI